MQFFENKVDLVKNKLSEKGLYDPRLLGLVLLAVISLSVLWSGVHVVQQNYTLLRKISLLEDQNRILELENRNREIQIEYYKTPEFAELKARRVNGKAAAGEKVYIVTDETALNSLKTPDATEKTLESVINKPKYQKNFEAWIDFFFGDKG